MSNNPDNKRNRRGLSRAGTVAAAAVSLCLTTGCTAALGELEAQVDPATSEAPRTAASFEPHVTEYLAPFEDLGDGTERKVGSVWYVREDGSWTEKAG
ncbi:MAG: hypothetical protein R2716_08375 [Microthrixaceae bacterium]